jgi:hypothetical protein
MYLCICVRNAVGYSSRTGIAGSYFIETFKVLGSFFLSKKLAVLGVMEAGRHMPVIPASHEVVIRRTAV